MKFELFQSLRDSDSDSEESDQRRKQPASGLSDQPQGMQPTGLTGQVENMFDQGYTEDEVKQELQGQYSEDEIREAVNKAITETATKTQQPGAPEPMTPYSEETENRSPDPASQELGQQEESVPQQDPGMQNNQSRSQADQTMTETVQQPNPPRPEGEAQDTETASSSSYSDASRTEELVEMVVAEKFQRVKSEFQNIYNEVSETQETVEILAEVVEDIEDDDIEKQSQIEERIGEVEAQLESEQSRMEGMERALQQVLPELTDNVRKLANTVQDVKQAEDQSFQGQESVEDETGSGNDTDQFTAFD